MTVTSGGAGSRYAAATHSLRVTTQWCVAAFAAVGGVLVAGLQLTQLGDLHQLPLQLALAALCLLVVLVAVVAVVKMIGEVLTDDWVTLTELGYELVEGDLNPTEAGEARQTLLLELEEKINAAAPELFGHVAPDLPSLHARLREANKMSSDMAAQASRPNDGDLAVLEYAVAVQTGAAAAVDCANYHRTVMLLKGSSRRLAVASIAIVAALVSFTLTTAWGKSLNTSQTPSPIPAASLEPSPTAGVAPGPAPPLPTAPRPGPPLPASTSP